MAKHKYKGLACTCSREEDMETCFCCKTIKDIKPRVLDYKNSYHYCPFVFVKEGNRLKDQMKESMLYTMNLEQLWEEIYRCEKDKLSENYVNVNVDVQNEVNLLFGLEAVKDDKYGPGSILWYSYVDNQGEVTSLGLSLAIVEKMNVVQELGGWVGGEDKDVKVERVEEYKGENGWKSFRCFVLVERFSLKRMDGTVILTCDYRHFHQIQCKW
ncbi:hypothetical protein ACHQM5_006841 [Ranunculus cassubicifolius]